MARVELLDHRDAQTPEALEQSGAHLRVRTAPDPGAQDDARGARQQARARPLAQPGTSARAERRAKVRTASASVGAREMVEPA